GRDRCRVDRGRAWLGGFDGAGPAPVGPAGPGLLRWVRRGRACSGGSDGTGPSGQARRARVWRGPDRAGGPARSVPLVRPRRQTYGVRPRRSNRRTVVPELRGLYGVSRELLEASSRAPAFLPRVCSSPFRERTWKGGSSGGTVGACRIVHALPSLLMA